MRNLDDDPNETLKGMNGLKWTTGRTDGVETPLGNQISVRNLDDGPNETPELCGMQDAGLWTNRAG